MVMGVNNLSQICRFVYATYGVHPYVKRHADGGMPFGYRLVHCKSRKQKLVTKSSTDEKLLRVSNYLPYNIRICLFMEALEYKIKHIIIFQDNQCTIRMAENGKKSCTGNSIHIDIHNFFIKYRVDSNYISITY